MDSFPDPRRRDQRTGSLLRSSRIGTLAVGQSGGPTAVINASLVGVIEEAMPAPQIDRVVGLRRGIEGLLEEDLIDLGRLPDAKLQALARTPGAALGACRRRITDEEAARAIAILRARDIPYFCYIGGNDSADTTHRLAEAARSTGYDLRAIAVPKTIDNDLPETDHSPGYGSIARYVAISTLESALDTRSLPISYPVKIIEVMGRDAGWVAAASSLASVDAELGPHLIYVPEVPFDAQQFIAAVAEIHRQVGYVVVVVAETVKDAHHAPIASDLVSVDHFGHPILRGTAETLVRLVKRELGLAARFDRPGSLQRSSLLMQSEVDLREARDCGRRAVQLALAGRSDRMVTIRRLGNHPYTSQLSSVELDRVANRQQLLPAEYLDKSGNSVSPEFRAYALPLLGPDPFPTYGYI